MANNKKWTKEEEEILVQAIQANPHNISEALRTASAKHVNFIGMQYYHLKINLIK